MSAKYRQVPIVIQARSSSSRLPSKVLLPFVDSMAMLEFQYKRLAQFFPHVVIATSTDSSDDSIYELCLKNSMNCFRGSLNNVMTRLVDSLSVFLPSVDTSSFIRVGGDDPLISPEGIELAYEQHLSRNSISCPVAMTYTSYDGGLPYGCASECFDTLLFKKLAASVFSITNIETRTLLLEHTKPAFFPPHISSIKCEVKRAPVPDWMKFTTVNLSIDYPEDFLFVSYIARCVISRYGLAYTHEDFIQILSSIPEKLKINQQLHSGFGE